MADTNHRSAAAQFAEVWAGRGDEKLETPLFWISLLQNVFGVEEPTKYIAKMSQQQFMTLLQHA